MVEKRLGKKKIRYSAKKLKKKHSIRAIKTQKLYRNYKSR